MVGDQGAQESDLAARVKLGVRQTRLLLAKLQQDMLVDQQMAETKEVAAVDHAVTEMDLEFAQEEDKYIEAMKQRNSRVSIHSVCVFCCCGVVVVRTAHEFFIFIVIYISTVALGSRAVGGRCGVSPRAHEKSSDGHQRRCECRTHRRYWRDIHTITQTEVEGCVLSVCPGSSVPWQSSLRRAVDV